MAAVQTIETAFCCNIDGLHKNEVYWQFLSADLEMMAQQWKIKSRDLFQSSARRPQDWERLMEFPAKSEDSEEKAIPIIQAQLKPKQHVNSISTADL